MITDDLFHIIVSWQMLVMYIGIGSISRRHYIGGLITFLVGAAFLLPRLGWMDSDWLQVYWPAAFVVVGLMLIFEPRKKNSYHYNSRREDTGGEDIRGNAVAGKVKSDFINTDGYVESDNTFGYVEQIILDPGI